MRSALPAARPQRWAQPDLTAGCCTSSACGGWLAGGFAAASLEIGWIGQRSRGRSVVPSHRRQRRWREHVRHGRARAILHGRCRGGCCSRSRLGFGWRIRLGAGLLGDPFGACVGDRLAGDRSLLRRRRVSAAEAPGAEAGGAARANLSSAVSLSSRRYQH